MVPPTAARLLLADGSVTRTLQDAPPQRACISVLPSSRPLAEHGVFNVLLSDSKCLYCSAAPTSFGSRACAVQAATLIDEDLT